MLVVNGKLGQANKLDESTAVEFSQARSLLGSAPYPNEQFGSSLASGDFDGDGRADLAIGVPGQAIIESFLESLGPIGHTEPILTGINAGAVHILYGAAKGLTTGSGSYYLTQSGVGIESSAPNDRFGFSLATGDFNADGRADLAVGSPFRKVAGFREAGAVSVVYGSSAGIIVPFPAPDGRIPQLLTDPAPTAGGHFGFTLSAWNFGRNVTLLPPKVPTKTIIRCADLAVGVPLKLFPDRKFRPAVRIYYGAQTGLGTKPVEQQEWTQDSLGVLGDSSVSNGFGTVGY